VTDLHSNALPSPIGVWQGGKVPPGTLAFLVGLFLCLLVLFVAILLAAWPFVGEP
jgi:hypothetical protein